MMHGAGNVLTHDGMVLLLQLDSLFSLLTLHNEMDSIK